MNRLGRLPARVAHGTRLLEAALLLTATRVVLRAAPRRLTATLLRKASVSAPQVGAAAEQPAREVADDVQRVAPLVPGSTCLGRGPCSCSTVRALRSRGAVCLLGTSGAGKSTLAAALNAAGHALISDAMTAIKVDDGGLPYASPGWPVSKLWPNTVHRLGLQPKGAVHADSDKLLCVPSGACASAPIAVRWYVGVVAGEVPELVRLSPSAGVMTLLRNHYLLDDTSPSEHPELLRRVARRLPRLE